ncbi:MAG: CoA ester lyase [Halanaeroarchaeum sp.]
MEPVRSFLYVPANKRDWVESAPDNEADGYIFDLEDAVPLDEKDEARGILADALDGFGGVDSVLAARINPPDTGEFDADLEAIVRPALDAIVLPKLPSPAAVRQADHVLTYLEAVRDIEEPIELIALPETANGFRRAYDLCSASDRVAGLVGGTTRGADIQRALGFTWTPEGDEKRYMLSKMVMDGRAAGVNQLFGGPWVDVEDIEGLRAEAQMAEEIGYTGYQVIHPSHIEPVNEIFLPDEAEIEWCQDLVSSIETAHATEGRGAIRHEGEMIDIGHLRRAEDILERARAFDLV